LEVARRPAVSTHEAAYLELALRLGAGLTSLPDSLKAAAKKRGVRLA
jgi:hypothetical protein